MSELLPAGPATHVEVLAKRGPRFYAREDGEPMFEFVNDGTSKISHPATDDDRREYPDAWTEYVMAAQEAGDPAARSNPSLPDIPASWHNLHHEDRKALASKIAGRDVTTAAEADMIIRAEVERREAEEDAAADEV